MSNSSIPSQFFHIAIDGPVAAGKGTIAKMLAARLKFLYVDTGAMYRAVTLLFLEKGVTISAENQAQLIEVLQQADLDLTNTVDDNGDLFTSVKLDGRDISAEIRAQAVNQSVSQVAALPAIRPILVAKQQALAQKSNLVMEGRDIGSKVLPNAQLKLYLTAALAERTRRRFQQLVQIEPNLTLAEVEQQIIERDERDSSRSTDPLTIVPDAIIIDTTNFNIKEVVDQIVGLVKVHQPLHF